MTSAPEITSLSIWTDGSVVDESAGIGYEIRAHGDKVSWFYNSVPECESSTQAEIHAIVASLKEANRFPNVDCVYVYTDSQSACHMIDPDERASANQKDIRDLVATAQRMMDDFEFANIIHKGREYNEDKAHDLANRAHRLSQTEGPKLRRSIKLSD